MARDWTQEEFGLTDRTPVLDIEALKRENKELESRLKKTQELELEVRKENAQLKDLLEIAIKVLKHYQDKHLCKEALKQIDEVLR